VKANSIVVVATTRCHFWRVSRYPYSITIRGGVYISETFILSNASINILSATDVSLTFCQWSI
jgi:hypothetical protein